MKGSQLNPGPLDRHSLVLYIILQSATLVACWVWFAGLWMVAFFGYSLDDLGWWLLVGAACAGLYGLRPNLERAIDSLWLQGVKNSQLLGDRVAQLRPIKRRIDVIFSALVVALLLLASLLYFSGAFRLATQ